MKEEKVALKEVLGLKRFDAITREYKNSEILVFGDLILDRFIYGDASRISPEAPVPVVLVHKEEYHLGGAGNVASNIRALGAQPFLISAVGKDKNGKIVKELLRKNEIETHLIERNFPTTIKTRVIARNQQVVRIDNEVVDRLNRTEVLSIKRILKEKTGRFNGMIISDYNKGFVSKDGISILLDIKKEGGGILTVDPKVEQFSHYKSVTCVTPNKKEASLFMHTREPEKISGVEKLARRLKNRLHCENILITLGKDGIFLLEKNGRTIHIPTAAKEVFDVTGAGDTVIGVFSLSLSAGASVLESAIIANVAAGRN